MDRKRKISSYHTLKGQGSRKKNKLENIVVDDDMTRGAMRDDTIGGQSSKKEFSTTTESCGDKAMAKTVNRKRKSSRCLTLEEGTTKKKRSQNEMVGEIGAQTSQEQISTPETSKLGHADTNPNGDHSLERKSNGVEKDAEKKSVMKNKENIGTPFKLKRGADAEIVQAYFSYGKRSSRFRPRKEVPTFRMVDLSENDDARIVDKRIKVFWPESRRWFTGHIKSFDGQKRLHNILYDDGDKEELDLRKERFEIEIMPTEGFRLTAESTYKKKVGRLGGDEVSKSMLREGTFKIADAERAMKSPETKKKNWSKNVGKRGNLKLKRKGTKVKEDLAPKIELDALSNNANKVIFDQIRAVEELGKAYFSLGNSSSRFRPRKEVPAFRMVDLNEDDYARIVDKRIKVFWPESRRWFTGHIKSFDEQKRLHNILYDDGDKEELDLRNERFQIEIMPTEAFHFTTKSTLKKKVGRLGGDGVSKIMLPDETFKVTDGERVIDLNVLPNNDNEVKVDEIPAAKEPGKANFDKVNDECKSLAELGRGMGLGNGDSEGSERTESDEYVKVVYAEIVKGFASSKKSDVEKLDVGMEVDVHHDGGIKNCRNFDLNVAYVYEEALELSLNLQPTTPNNPEEEDLCILQQKQKMEQLQWLKL